jgi:hypothetical protein
MPTNLPARRMRLYHQLHHRTYNHWSLPDLTRDVLVPYVLTEGSQVWSFALDR